MDKAKGGKIEGSGGGSGGRVGQKIEATVLEQQYKRHSLKSPPEQTP